MTRTGFGPTFVPAVVMIPAGRRGVASRWLRPAGRPPVVEAVRFGGEPRPVFYKVEN